MWMGNGMTVWVSDYKEYEGKRAGQFAYFVYKSFLAFSSSSIIFHMAFIKKST